VIRRLLPAALAALGLAALCLAACGGGTPADSGPPPDVKLDQANIAGTQALSADLPGVAVRQYKIALARAYERDDAAAIADVGYNLALAQMKAGDAKTALATLRDIRGDLDRRGAAVPSELFLVQAAAAYRAGDLASADAAAQEMLTRGTKDADAVARAWFIRGLVAADRGDGAALAQAIAALPPATQTDLQGDRLELQGRAALLGGQAAEALPLLEQAAAKRQQALDYRGMARDLALAGDAALGLDKTADAADYFLRAGRSVLLQGDKTTGLALLKRAEDLAKQTGHSGMVDEIARLRKVAAEQNAKS
jgi:hypothetical protein